ncbi:MAG: Enoyl-[acyl-carrier-protein] reductase [FMN] [uncultured Thermomicrobiales bacterium]|uniref:Enoyl-[acyl-carrier-protein] reductase [FMN] n=1 Tax=uncultured Thermomicrobiales bacterium TaxID=1645740 RepID=A0A6J4UI14_9BACT|nr:MAG: Enoyl-[acyl-carrier-protein] reductase [FMN] [uncultured Thermomicrobiales bacterium]
MLRTPLCDALGIAHPICQAGMANYTSPELVAAVSRAGGLGVHGTLDRPPEALQAVLRATRDLLDGEPFGVNLVLSRLDEAAFAVCLAERVPIYCFSWGDPGPWVRQVRASGARVIAQVTTVAEVPTALAAGVDAIVAQGTEGGGHSGFVPLAQLLPAVAAAAGGTPVLAAGGIVDGHGLAAALALGAAGGWLGTRFLATPEAPISPAWQAAILAARAGDTIHTEAFDRLWGRPWPGARVRALRNRFTDEWAGREEALLASRDAVQRAVWRAEREDDPSLFALMAGSGVGAIREISPAGELVRSIVAQAEATIARLAGFTAPRPRERRGIAP